MIPPSELIALLTDLKPGHYQAVSEDAHDFSCPVRFHVVGPPTGVCNCGAAELNARIDAMIDRLNKETTP